MGKMPLLSSVTLYLKECGSIHKTSFTHTKHCVTTEQQHLRFVSHIKPGFLMFLLEAALTPAGELLSTSKSTPLRHIKLFPTQQWTDPINYATYLCIVWLLKKTPLFMRKDLTSYKLLEKMWCSMMWCCNDLPFFKKVLPSVTIERSRGRAYKSAFSLIPKIKTTC